MSECNHDCGSCTANCSSRTESKESFLVPQNELSNVKNVIGVVSGKGGVGKSLVTSLLAAAMQRRGYKTAILDADVTGPSIPKTFGITEKAESSGMGVLPVMSKTGIEIMSVNLLLEDETEPVVWRGPVIAGTVKQFWTDAVWGSLDYMIVDCPPGTGDVPLTVFQSLPLDGIIIVTSPQELVSMIVGKAVRMAQLMNIPIIGVVENMSYVKCPDCGKELHIFGDSHVEEVAKEYDIPVLAKMPIDPALANLCDKGAIELFEGDAIAPVADAVEATPCRVRDEEETEE